MAKTVQDFITGLQILYKNNLDAAYVLAAEHDVIYCGGEDIPEDSETGKQRDALGFHWDSEFDGWAYFT